jgi:hypothetical protein
MGVGTIAISRGYLEYGVNGWKDGEHISQTGQLLERLYNRGQVHDYHQGNM